MGQSLIIVSYMVPIVLLLALSAFFSCSETILFSLTSIQRQRIKAKSPAADAAIGKCLGDSAMLLSTLLVGNTFVNFTVATLGYKAFTVLSGDAGSFLCVPVMTILLLVFGEIMPKQIALLRAESLAPLCARLLLFWRTILTPFNIVLRALSRSYAGALERERRALSDSELISYLDAAAERGEFSSVDADMVEGVLRLSELCANDEMIPRVDMQTYDLDLCEEERRKSIAETSHRFLPVIRRTPDAIEGIYDVKTGEISDALFVPETVTLDDLLVTFRRSKKPLAVVLDEYGGTAGIISPEDILEIIFGPSVFAHPGEEPSIVEVENGVWEIDARANLDEVNRLLGVDLFAGDADRLSGWVAFHAERLPHVGQEIEADGCLATILKRRRRRVVLVRLVILEKPKPESDEQIIADTDEEVERTMEDDIS
jgi:putative hemolysin